MDKAVHDYLDAVPEPRKATVDQLHRLIIELYPDANIDMSYRMPTYRSGEGWIALANQKQYISLYTCGAHHLEAFKAQHPSIKTGKGCINFRSSDTLPLPAIRRVIHSAMQQNKH